MLFISDMGIFSSIATDFDAHNLFFSAFCDFINKNCNTYKMYDNNIFVD